MADNLIVRPRVAPSRAPRRGFRVFCALLALVIGALIVGPVRTSPATAGRTVRPASPPHGDVATPAVGTPGVAPEEPVAGPRGEGGGTLGTLAALAPLIDAGEPVYCGAGTRPFVALTFDDGPGPFTRQTIDLLREHAMTATFFEVGKLLGEVRFEGLPRAAARLGAVGDHTWDHVSVVGMSRRELQAQVARTRRAVAKAAGERVFLFRPPLGQHDATVDAYLRSLGMLQVLWSLDSGDSEGPGPDRIFRTVRESLSPGDIVLLHENRGTTQRALPRILELIQARGYTTVTVPQLLALDPPTREQLRHHTCAA